MRGSARNTRRGIWFSAAILLSAMAVTASALVATAGSGGSSGATGPAIIHTHDAVKASPPTWGLFSRPHMGHPGAPVWAPDGTIYMTDCANARIYRVTPRRKIVVFGGSGPGGFPHYRLVPNYGWASADAYGGDGRHPTDALFSCPAGLAFDAAGDMFIADHLNGRIREINTSGYVSTVAGTGPGGKWGGPFTPGVGPSAGDGGPAINGILVSPLGIAFDAAGNLYIADRDHDAIRKVDTNGILTTVAGIGWRGYNGDHRLATTARLNRPIFVAFDAAGNMYISDENNYRIRKVDGSGMISTFAGTGRYACGGDGGPATHASLKNPGQILVEPDGSMLISDGECFRIKRVAPDGTMSTYAGNGKKGCGGIGRDVSKLKINGDVGLSLGPDGDTYITVCNKVVRVDGSGKTNLFIKTPPDPRKHH